MHCRTCLSSTLARLLVLAWRVHAGGCGTAACMWHGVGSHGTRLHDDGPSCIWGRNEEERRVSGVRLGTAEEGVLVRQVACAVPLS